MSTAVMWSKLKPDVEFQYGGRLGDFHGMSPQSHVSHCRVLPLGKFTVVISEPHATLQGAVTWRNQCHDRATLQGVIILSAILKIVFRLFFLFFNAIWAFTSGGLFIHIFRVLTTVQSNEVAFDPSFPAFVHKLLRLPHSAERFVFCETDVSSWYYQVTHNIRVSQLSYNMSSEIRGPLWCHTRLLNWLVIIVIIIT